MIDDDLLEPLASLMRKTEKAQQKLAAGTWQHDMLSENLKALRLAEQCLNGDAEGSADASPSDRLAAQRAFAEMIGKTEQAQTKFAFGSSQHTLLENRRRALCHGRDAIAVPAEQAPYLSL